MIIEAKITELSGGNNFILHCCEEISLLKFGEICFWLIFALLLKKGADLVAQLVEQYTFNVWVLGSSPSRITVKRQLPLFLCSPCTGLELR